jgi:hypothetical protein
MFPQLFFGQRDTAECAVRGELRVTERDTGLHLLLNFEREVDLELAVQVVVFAFAPAPETQISHDLRPTPAPSPDQSRARVAATSNARWRAASCLQLLNGSTSPPGFGLALVPNSL